MFSNTNVRVKISSKALPITVTVKSISSSDLDAASNTH